MWAYRGRLAHAKRYRFARSAKIAGFSPVQVGFHDRSWAHGCPDFQLPKALGRHLQPMHDGFEIVAVWYSILFEAYALKCFFPYLISLMRSPSLATITSTSSVIITHWRSDIPTMTFLLLIE